VSLVGLGPERNGLKVKAVVGVPAAALRVNKQQLRNAMKGIVDSLMIVSEPFAVAYGLEALVHSLIIDIGAGTCDFCVMNGRYPTDDDQRTLTLAGDYVDEQLHQLIAARYPEASVSRQMIRQWKESFSFVGPPPEIPEVVAPVQGRPTRLEITEPMRAACESIVPAIVETMLDLISRVEPEYQENVRNNVVLSGGSGLIRGLGLALQDALEDVGGGRVRVVADPLHVGSDGGLALAMDAPESEWEKLAA
jgi:rod shape-determining protein MreB